MTEDQRLIALRQEAANELQQRAERWRVIQRESAEQTRIHLDHWRTHVRQRYFDAWLDITARKLGKPREAVRLHTIPETYTLQDTQNRGGIFGGDRTDSSRFPRSTDQAAGKN